MLKSSRLGERNDGHDVPDNVNISAELEKQNIQTSYIIT